MLGAVVVDGSADLPVQSGGRLMAAFLRLVPPPPPEPPRKGKAMARRDLRLARNEEVRRKNQGGRLPRLPMVFDFDLGAVRYAGLVIPAEELGNDNREPR